MKIKPQNLAGLVLGIVAAASTATVVAGPAPPPGSSVIPPPKKIVITRVVRMSPSRIAVYGRGFHRTQVYNGGRYDISIRKAGEQTLSGMPIYHWSANRIDARIGYWREPGTYYVYIMGPFRKPVSRGFRFRVLPTVKPGTAKQLRQGNQAPHIGNKPIQIQPALPGQR